MAIRYEGHLNRGLPKWPAIVVVGEPVTECQAAEIILRTDYHIPNIWGNDRSFARQVNDLFGIPPEEKYPGKDASVEEKAEHAKLSRRRFWAMDKLRNALGSLDIEYLCHDRVMSAYIGGTNGWCNWNGAIGLRDKNIGKWPEIEDVAKEWQTIIDAFPYLRLRCQLFDDEHCADLPARPVAHYIVQDGDVIVRPSNGVVLSEPVGLDMEDVKASMYMGSFGAARDLSITELEAKLKLVYGDIPQYTEVGADDE